MTDRLRRAGRGRTDDGAVLVWSVAEGERGRRWRAAATRAGDLDHVLLLEVDVAGRPARLEHATRFGLLTVHPAADARTLHGNVVDRRGVRPVELPWTERHAMEVAGEPIAIAAQLHGLAADVGVGEERRVSVLVVAADLSLVVDLRTIRRVSDGRWRIEGAARTFEVEIDPRGIPVLRDAKEWPLEEG